MHLFDIDAAEEEALCGVNTTDGDTRGVEGYLDDRLDDNWIGTICEGCKALAAPFATKRGRDLEAEGLLDEAEEYRRLADTLARDWPGRYRRLGDRVTPPSVYTALLRFSNLRAQPASPAFRLSRRTGAQGRGRPPGRATPSCDAGWAETCLLSRATPCGDRFRCVGQSPPTTGRTPPGTASIAAGSRRGCRGFLFGGVRAVEASHKALSEHSR